MVGGIALLLNGSALMFAGRERPEGTALIPVRNWMVSVYPAICLAFVAFGRDRFRFAWIHAEAKAAGQRAPHLIPPESELS